MVDRLEELLALMEDEDDEDERRDALEMTAAPVPAVPAAEHGAEDVPGDGADRADLRLDGNEGPSWTPDGETPAAEGREEVPEAGGAAENRGAEREAAAFLRDEPAAPVMGPGGFAVLRRPGSRDVELTELAGPSGQGGVPAKIDGAADSVRPADGGLEGLYRQTVRASRPAAQNLPVEQAGRSTRAEEPGSAAALTVDELDRAVRRDSRRYDGGMTLF